MERVVNEDYDEAFVYEQLANVGKFAPFKGGFRLHEGSKSYREKSWIVAEFGKRHGVDLLRKTGGTTSFLMMPVPDGDYIAIEDKLAYANNKNLPSVSLGPSSEIAKFLTCYADDQFSKGHQFWMLTIPAFGCRFQIGELREAITEAFERFKSLRTVLSDTEGGWVEVIFAQLELPFRDCDTTFFPHFHIVLESSGQQEIEAEIRSLLLGVAQGFGLNWASVDLKPVSRERFPAVACYCTKPSETAYQLAEANEPEIFKEYVNNVSKHRARRCIGDFQKYRKHAEDNGLKPERVWSKKGRATVQLVNKAKRKSEVEKETETTIIEPSADDRDSDKRDGAASEREGRDELFDHKAVHGKANVFCGVTAPSPAPGNRLISYGVVKDFDPSQFRRGNRSEGQFAYDWANSEALMAWEKNTGKEYSLREFLEPFAEDLAKALEDQGNVPYYTLTVSSGVLKTLREILEEKKSELTKKNLEQG